jgi:predicted transcriptional regulator
MTPAKAVLSLSPEMSLRQALRIMLARGVHAAPVIDAQARTAKHAACSSWSHVVLRRAACLAC